MISPSRFLSLKQCILKELWSAVRQPRLLPRSPAAYLGIVIHKLFELAFHGKINDEASMSSFWNHEIRCIEDEMLKYTFEKNLVPLEMSAFKFEVKKILAYKMIRTFFNYNRHKKNGKKKSGTEVWVQTADGKVGGRIDLIRETGDGIEIIDYKTGDLTNRFNNCIPKEEYQQQIKLYGALYHAVYNIWPVRFLLIGLNGSIFKIDVNKDECLCLLKEARRNLEDINELVDAGLKPADFASPSAEVCKYCLYRPACNKYWVTRKDHEKWPVDVKGKVEAKKVLASGFLKIIIRTESREVSIRGLSTEKHTFLKEDIKGALFCDLGQDTADDFYIEKLLTTGYAL